MNTFVSRSVVLSVAMLGAMHTSFCATAEEAMLEADKIDVEILKQAIDFSRANILKKQANVLSAQNELKESKRWLCRFEQEKRELEAKKLFSSIKNVFKKMWHSYPYGLKYIVRAMGSPVNLSLHAGYAIASALCVYYKIPIFRWSTEPGTLADCAKLQAIIAAAGLACGYLGTFIAAEN